MLTLEKTLNIRIPTQLHCQLEELTKATGRSKSFLANEALESYLAYQTWQLAQVEIGLAEADRGEFATSADMQKIITRYA